MTNLGDNTGAEMIATQQARSEMETVLHKSLQHHFSNTLSLPDEASKFLLDIWEAIQLFDDVADDDQIKRSDLDRVIWSLLVGIHSNHFFEVKKHAILPILATMVLKWQASDQVERQGEADARSYMWRAGYYDLVLIVVQVCHGVDDAIKLAPIVMKMYGEKIEDYMVEFENA